MEWKKGVRTDLAVEALELGEETDGAALPGMRHRAFERCGIPVTEVEILDNDAAQRLGKPIGHYLTLTLGELPGRMGDTFERTVQAVTETLMGLLPQGDSSPALVIGLGNRNITPDAVGPIAIDHTLATRHLITQAPEYFGQWRPVAAVHTGVVGSTGVESAELIQALAREIKPAVVIAVDALAARRQERVCRTIQVSNTGIVPGSGVGNARMALDEEHLGLPVLAVGVPTVVEAGTLCLDLLEEAGSDREGLEPSRQFGQGSAWFVTPRNIDSEVEVLSKILGLGISAALHVDISVEDVENLVG